MSVLKKLEDQLKCPICLDTYTNPKQLQCNHVYCQQCLVRLVVRDQQEQLSLTCPSCRQVAPIPASGVEGLQPAFRVNQLLEIVEEQKKVTATTENAQSAFAGPTSHSKITVVCLEHGGKEVDLYCETCGETICWECIMRGSKHHSHEYEKLNKAFEQYTEEISLSLDPLEKQLMTIEEALKVFDACHAKISDQRAAIKTDIHNTITRLQVKLHDTLEARKTVLINQLDKLTQAKLKSLAAHRDQIETTHAQLSSCLLFIKENIKTGNQGQALKMKSITVRQVKELTTTFQPDMLEPTTEANMIFSALELADLTTECQNYGKVNEVGIPDPSNSFIIGKEVYTAAVGEKSTAILQVLDLNDQPCKPLMSSISCELVSEITGTRARGSLQRTGLSQYEISYQPTFKGRHQLHIKVEGQHIRGSPFPVSAKSPVENLDTPILTIGGLKGPLGVAVTKTGKVVVTECHEHCVSVFSPSGKRLQSFGTKGSEQGQFSYPVGVAVDGEENILVADQRNNRIQKFTTQGKFLKAVGTKGTKPLQFDHPLGIAVSATNRWTYVVDNNNSRIQILNSDLSYIGTFGKKGIDMGQFINIQCIACDSIGNVYVADSGSNCIKVFTAEGKFLRMFGGGRGELGGPHGVAVSCDRVYVSEWGKHRVSIFTLEGQFVSSFSSVGEEFCHPQGLAVDSSGVVYVCEENCNRVRLF